MKNFEKYEEEVKKTNYEFAVNKYTKELMICGSNCEECLFNAKCSNGYKNLYLERMDWLYSIYNPKAQLTIKEIEELLKDKYPNGIEVVE